jgi:hypothetical protein
MTLPYGDLILPIRLNGNIRAEVFGALGIDQDWRDSTLDVAWLAA